MEYLKDYLCQKVREQSINTYINKYVKKDGHMLKGHRNQPELAPKDHLSNKISDIALDYNPKYKVNRHEFILL